MSEKQEKRKRYNAKIAYMAEFEKWLLQEPPMIRFFKWHRWKENRPNLSQKWTGRGKK